ncbi:DUF1778 domain-containing protein [Deinococcus depolymerans]|uniref:DUF1778 domain-containing protein n=1 Tax=Deinococcus depolymerans TaxID=392408 RepID=A0ABN1CQI2_9DEIO
MTATKEKTAKDARLEFRVPGRQKEIIESAANLQGVTVSDFLASVAHREAVKVIRDNAVIQLTHDQSVRFVEALLSPPAPNEALRNLMRSKAADRVH